MRTELRGTGILPTSVATKNVLTKAKSKQPRLQNSENVR